MKLSIEELKELRIEAELMENSGVVAALDELIALKGDQVPVSMDALRDAVAEMSGGLQMEWKEGDDKGHHAVPFINFNTLHRIVTKFTSPQKPVEDYFSSLVAMGKIAAEKAMRKYPQPNYVLLKVAEEAGEVVRAAVHYAENRMTWAELEGEVIQLIAMLNRLMVEGDQINGVTPPLAIVAAGCIVQTVDADKEDDHQSSAPAVLRDVLTAVSIGGSRTELIDALTAIKPKFGAPGSRDVDVRAAHVAIDKAIEKLSNL